MSRYWRIVFLGSVVLLAVAAFAAFRAWRAIMGPATRFQAESVVLFVPTGAGFRQVTDSLLALGAIHDERAWHWLARRKNYVGRVKPGRYRIPRGMSLNGLVNMLRAGEQEPVNVTFTNIDHLYEFAGRVAHYLEPDSAAFLRALQDPALQREVGMDEPTIIALFIPDTYRFLWNTTPEAFVQRMRREHDAFWTGTRRAKAEALGLTPVEVTTLASIVQAETGRFSDAPIIAGVYLNRLRIGMPLQADPTLKFALGLEGVNRLLNKDKEVDSPYNTYKRTGLPPGPILMAEPRFIDAVLHAQQHDYLYFCARADLSGYSEFARTYEQHLVNARRYQRALNERGIYR